MPPDADIAIIGSGAAGLFAAIWAGRTAREANSAARIIALDGAKRLGAKILVAGGGRCNVTHHAVDETAYAGSSRNAIKNVLRRFDVPRTVAFFEEFGVTLKREDTGKLFPTTDDAHTILDALLRAAGDAGAELVYPWRVESVRRDADGFAILREQDAATIRARCIILAAGGKALPKSGSDGRGYEIAKSLGHTITRTFPGLVPLLLSDEGAGKWIKELSGLTLPATIELLSGTGKKLISFTNSTLCTHFGLSGPGVLDISRYYTDARASDPGARLIMNWLPGPPAMTFDTADAWIAEANKSTIARRLAEKLPERMARALCTSAGADPAAQIGNLKRDIRREVVRRAVATELPVTGDRGYTHAEVTAGGIPLSEVHLDTMESRICPGLHICGEICDVDGRIGGFNFQWAWASGYAAGVGAARSINKKNSERSE